MTGPAPQVRELAPSESQALAALLTRLAAETPHVLLSVAEARAAEPAQAARGRRAVEAPNQQIFVAETAGALIGFVGLTQGLFEKNRHAASLMIGVLESHWGAGVADALMQASIGWASARGIRRIELTVMTDNARALAFYARYGFEREGTKRRSLRVDGQWKDELMLARMVDATPG